MGAGAICLEVARQWGGVEVLRLAIRSLTKARQASITPLPIISVLMAQAEGSLGFKEKWENNLRLEWFTWPPGNCVTKLS